jgi:hypothetical protein
MGGPVVMAHVSWRNSNPRTWRRFAFVALPTSVVALVASTAAVAAPASAGLNATTVQASTPIAAAESPFRQAQRTGKKVEITTARTEYNTSYADPAGTTTLAMSSEPVRVRRGAGWVLPDPTLAARADGMIAPRASTIDVAFSSGGQVPLATLRHGSETLQIAAPMALPAPVLAGTSATYPNVLPDVDLVMTVTGESFSEVFVVKTAAAAANPALETLRFGLADTGLDMLRTASGGIDVKDSSGNRVLGAAQPMMWDSTSSTQSGASAGGQETSVAGPSEGDKQAPIAVSASASALTLTPQRSLLTSADTTFPVYIDPEIHPTATKWTMVAKAFPTTSYYKWTDSNGEGVGYYNVSGDGPYTKRLFYGFNTGSLRVTGRTIVSATFQTHETWAYTCTTAGIEAWLTGNISSSTDWNSQPTWSGPSTVRSVATSGRPDCSPAGTEIDFNTKNQVIKSVLDNRVWTTLGLKATSETSNSGWRRFTSAAKLVVVYNSYPNTPSGLQMTSPPTKCGGAVPAGDMPIMRVTGTDPDNDPQDETQVRAHFQIFKSGTATPLTPEYTTAYKPSGSSFTQQVPKLAEGFYTWRAYLQDDGVPALTGAWTGLCNFTVDGTLPTPPTIALVGAANWTVGQNVTFHFSGGGSDVTSYKWAVNTDAPTSAAVLPAANATVHLSTFGPFTLRAWAFDAAGHQSAEATYGGDEFLVAGADARDWWRMDEGSGTVSANQRSTGNGLLTTGTVGWVPGWPTTSAMVFDGTNFGAGIGQGGPATGENFSVSAWGNPSTTAGRQVLLSQDAGANSAFTVAIETIAGPAGPDGVAGPVLPRFVARLHTATGATALKAVSSRPLSEDEWAHMSLTVQTLESGAIELALYTTVAGDAQITEDTETSTTSTPDYATSTATNAYVRVGVEISSYAGANYWTGAVDDVVTAKGVFDELQRNQWRYPL